MKYLLTYSAEVEGNNGYYNEDFNEVKDSIEELGESIASLESKEGKNFSFEIFELHEFDSSSIKINEVYLKTKKNIEYRESVDKLENQISSKKYLIFDHKAAEKKYGKWDKFDDQLSAMENELSILEAQLSNKLRK